MEIAVRRYFDSNLFARFIVGIDDFSAVIVTSPWCFTLHNLYDGHVAQFEFFRDETDAVGKSDENAFGIVSTLATTFTYHLCPWISGR